MTDASGSVGTIHVSGSKAEIRFDSLALATESAGIQFSGDSGGFSTIFVENRSPATTNNRLAAPIVIHDNAKIEVVRGAGIAVFSQPSYSFANTRTASTEGSWGIATSADGLKLVAMPQNGIVLPMNQRYSFGEVLTAEV